MNPTPRQVLEQVATRLTNTYAGATKTVQKTWTVIELPTRNTLVDIDLLVPNRTILLITLHTPQATAQLKVPAHMGATTITNRITQIADALHTPESTQDHG